MVATRVLGDSSRKRKLAHSQMPRPFSRMQSGRWEKTKRPLTRTRDSIGVGKERRREAIRIDTVEKVTPKQIQTNKAKFDAESGFQVGRSAPEFQMTPLTPEHEAEIKAREQLAEQQAADREAILQKRESLHRLFPEKYAPDVSVFTNGKVEIMFKLSYEQAENLARLMKGHDL